MLELRDYQKEAIKSLYDYWTEKKGNNPIISACVGAGKSLLISKVIKDALEFNSNSKILILTHLAELLEQNADELKRLDNEIDISIYSAGLNKRCLKSNVIYAGIQSIHKKIEQLPKIDLILIDECHLVPKNSNTMYRKTINFLKSKNELLKVVGFSGTPYRLDGYLHTGKNSIFDGIAYNISIKDLVDKGYLCKPIGKNSKSKFDLSNISIKNGEFDNIELATLTNKTETIEKSVSEFVELGKDRKAWLVFCSGVEHSELVQKELLKYNIVSEIVTGETKKEDRAKILSDFKNGLLKCLININTLVAGYNAPICDMVVMLRATMSGALFQQCIGRGLRLYDGKKDALILDYGSNFERFGTIDNFEPIIKGSGKKSDKPIQAKECKKCQTLNHIRVSKCVECGEEFPRDERELNHNNKAYDGAMFSEDIKPIELFVDNTYYYKHISKSGNECLKITYICGLNVVNEYVVLNSFFGKKILEKMNCYFDNIDDILVLENRKDFLEPIKLKVKKEGKYMKIEDKIFEEKIKTNELKCCNNCINLENKQSENSFKKIKFCSEFKTEITQEWLFVEQNPICPNLDFCPF
jgi:DNA repair protein RadD